MQKRNRISIYIATVILFLLTGVGSVIIGAAAYLGYKLSSKNEDSDLL